MDIKIMPKAHPIRNLTLNNFLLSNRFNMPHGSRRYEVVEMKILIIASRYTANSTILDPYILSSH